VGRWKTGRDQVFQQYDVLSKRLLNARTTAGGKCTGPLDDTTAHPSLTGLNFDGTRLRFQEKL